MSSKRSFRYLASVVTLYPRSNRPLPFSLRKRDFLISKKVYSCTFFFLEPFQISRYTRYGGAKVGWKYGVGGRISHGFREWPPEAFNQLANSTVLYPSKPLTKNSSEGRKSREGWEKSRYPSRGGFCVNAPAALLLSSEDICRPRVMLSVAFTCLSVYFGACLDNRLNFELSWWYSITSGIVAKLGFCFEG